MRTRLLLDRLPGLTASAEVVAWRVDEGDAVRFGDVLCELEARTVHVFDREYEGASRLRRLRLRLDGRKPVQERPARAATPVRVVAAEDGVVARIEVPRGRAVPEGAVLALMAGSADETAAGDDAAALPAFRAVVELGEADVAREVD